MPGPAPELYNVFGFNPKRLRHVHTLYQAPSRSDDMMGFVSQSQTRFIFLIRHLVKNSPGIDT